MRPTLCAAALAAAVLLFLPARSDACTSILVSKGASADGSTMVTYAADSHTFYGDLAFTPAARHKKGAQRAIIEWDSGKPVGHIPQVSRTYKVIGHMNEHQLVIGETTFTGRKELVNPQGGIDYGSLMQLALERARTAREAIQVMTDLVAEHGYRSTGESFSIADPNETWLMEMIGKGPDKKGAVWVALRVPDGYITAHANQARIRRFPLNDPESCLYAPDVISLAREKGWFTGKDEEFSFADAYAPLTWRSLRTCEARVWSVFRRVLPSNPPSSDWIHGVPGATPLPLWVKPEKPLSVRDVMALMRDHFEGTEFDMTQDVGAGPFKLPYRWRPMTFTVDGVEYINERAISTQQTGFSFVSQSRAGLPDPVGGLLWFGVDDTYSTVYVPIYAGITKPPRSYAQGTGSFAKVNRESAFWAFNAVANRAYGRYSDMIVDIQKVQRELEDSYFAEQPQVEKRAVELHAKNPKAAERYLTEYSTKKAEAAVARWRELDDELLLKYLDGNVRNEKGEVTHPPYSEDWLCRIAKETGDRLKTRKLPGEPEKKPQPAPAPAAVGQPR
jgi:dipeptidase